MAVLLLEVPMGKGEDHLLVETDPRDIGGPVLAAPKPGEAAAKATQTLTESLGKLEPMLRAVKERLAACAPEAFQVEFGVKLGGETGIILAKGTAEVNLKITMTWDSRIDGGPASALDE